MRRFRPLRPRRRGFRRLAAGLFGPPAGPRAGLGARPIQELDRAHRLMAAGDYDEAADLFGQLADGAEAHGMPKRAAHLRLQTARALLELGQADEAVERVKRGLAMFTAAGNPGRAAQLAARIAGEFRARGFNAQADALTPFPPLPTGTSRSGEGESRRGTLPAKCPHCGGAMRPDEVEWIDQSSAECDYCGSVVKVE